MLLNYKKYGEGEPLFIIHGVFGMLDNWQSLGKQWSDDFEIYLIDARNHGRSDHSETMTFEEMADDLKELLDHLGLEKMNLLGHSMGGKIAMKFAMLYPQLIEKLMVIDIGPKSYPMHHQGILKGLELLNFENYNSRKEVDSDLSKYVTDPGVRQFLLKNLYWKEKGKLALRMNLPVISENMINIIDTVGYDSIDSPTLFVRGLLSDYIVDEDIDSIHIQFTDSEIVDVPNAGHWIHAQQPLMLHQIILDFLKP
ncbi:MAG: esterase [Patiriisocius sp.]|jgi:esterase